MKVLGEQGLVIELPCAEVTDVGGDEAIDALLLADERDFVVGSPWRSDRENVKELVRKLAADRHHRRSYDLVKLFVEEIPHAAGEIPSNSKASAMASSSSQG